MLFPSQTSTPAAYVYSRESAPNTTRLETLLTALVDASCVTYASGLAALHAAYVFLRPARVSIGPVYHGSHGVLAIHQTLAGTQILPLDCPASALHAGDVVHLETPVNPTGEAHEIAAFAKKAHSRGAFLLVDATFGPPGLQQPFAWGADLVLHSGTKYIGGHSDLLCGVVACQREDWIHRLKAARTNLGAVMGSLEAWLAVRSLRTLTLRVHRQSESANRLVTWLDACARGDYGGDPDLAAAHQVVLRVQHASLQARDAAWLRAQMPRGGGPVFALWMRTEALARRLPSTLALWRHATSLGGVESLVEWRAMSDKAVDGRVVRCSVGVEDCADLRRDLEAGFRKLGARL